MGDDGEEEMAWMRVVRAARLFLEGETNAAGDRFGGDDDLMPVKAGVMSAIVDTLCIL
jgi:hypothetical protein